ncbi:probable Haloacid dehalogenase, type II [Psychrobacter arcticus 273-4]|uniref:Probable Haloacid dehalogenase, type II n=1 Tax=Psychrobacter arcticus (strain DSM 17307 / VKM B-2377 / 273-4) TaxID=259536 RepID=Q4FRW4_PSYA2|nr:haloacid dehalogenase type II [Psychrobacter arcticus]AAZ19244.1 probable Haloacid dehalogenase, type II [Psychrobacter arcticus 273-4]
MSSIYSAPILVFDVNETLLDIDTLTPLFTRLFGDENRLREWFAQLVLYSQTMTLSGLYTPFGELGVGALQMTADIHAVTLTEEDIQEFKQRMSETPAHPDVIPALTKLRDAGFRLVTLTNSAPSTSPTRLEKAGLSEFFEQNFSVDSVRQFKPAPAIYQMVASELSVETSELCLVACHIWDTIGAQAAGCQGAFVTRPYNALLSAPNVPKPDFIASDLITLAEHIINHQSS